MVSALSAGFCSFSTATCFFLPTAPFCQRLCSDKGDPQLVEQGGRSVASLSEELIGMAPALADELEELAPKKD